MLPTPLTNSAFRAFVQAHAVLAGGGSAQTILAADRLARCRPCGSFDADRDVCDLYGGPACRWRSYLTRPGAVCLAVPPRWPPVAACTGAALMPATSIP